MGRAAAALGIIGDWLKREDVPEPGNYIFKAGNVSFVVITDFEINTYGNGFDKRTEDVSNISFNYNNTSYSYTPANLTAVMQGDSVIMLPENPAVLVMEVNKMSGMMITPMDVVSGSDYGHLRDSKRDGIEGDYYIQGEGAIVI